MACFVVPLSVGICTTIFRKKVPEALKIGWLNMMLLGGVLMLVVDHIISQEIVLYPPFLTAMQTPTQIPIMLNEMAVVGGTMTLAVVCIWVVLVVLSQKMPHHIKKALKL
jgi:hypothetical protein